MGFPQYDVFISYAHADNEIPEGTVGRCGWVTALANNLNVGPNVLKKSLFIDHQLKPGDEFSSDLLNKLENSRLLVLLLSQNYIDSKWCGRELEHFTRSHGSDPDSPADVIVVELFPFEALEKIPDSILNLRKRLIHAKFWYSPPDKSSPCVAGYPTPAECGDEGKQHYWSVLEQLRAAIDARLRVRRADPPAPEAVRPTAVAPEAGAPAVLGTVLLADVTEDLEAHRNAVKLALEPEGIAVLPDGDYVGLSADEFETAFNTDLARSGLFIQLLSPTPGRKGRGYTAPLPQLQFAGAQASGKPMMQWCEQLPASGSIADPDHERLFQTEFLRATNLANFKAEVIERMHAEYKRRELEAKAATPTAAANGKKLLFVDDLASQPELNTRLRRLIKEQNCDIRSLPPSAPLGCNGIDIKEVLKPCRAGLTIYTDPSRYATAFNRLMFFLNQIAEARLPLARWGIYLQEGDVASVFGIDSADVVPVDEHGLGAFLRAL